MLPPREVVKLLPSAPKKKGAACTMSPPFALTKSRPRSLTVFGIVLYLLGGVGLPTPDLEAWLTKNRPAIGSPRLAQTVRADG